MDRSQVVKQIEKLLSRLIFDKKGIKINVVPYDKNLNYSNEFPSYKKYIINVHVNPYKFNDVNDEFDQSYYDFMISADDVVDDNVKYLGIETEDIAVRYIIDDQDNFISMVENIVYNKWPEVEKEFKIQYVTSRIGPEQDLDLTEVSMRQRGPRYPEFHIFIGTKLTEYPTVSTTNNRIHEIIWNAVHEILPIGEMFVELV
jgi:hypothetical protein